MAGKLTYIHDADLHNMRSPKAFVPVLVELFQPKSVVDFGCGIGNFLEVFTQHGVTDVLGIEGDWVNLKMLSNHLSPEHLKTADLTQELKLDRKFDIAISFEVAEHLPPEAAKQFIETLTSSSDIVVFSAAVPYQAGQNHLNEQWPEYWANIFSQYHFHQFDLIRPRIWNTDQIQVWYRQNTFVYIREGVKHHFETVSFPENFRAIHPEMYSYKAQKLEEILRGRITLEESLKIFAKTVLNKMLLR